MSEANITPNKPNLPIFAEQNKGGEQASAHDMETYLLQHRDLTAEQAEQIVGQILDGLEVAPGAWNRPGAKALTAAAAEWASQDPTRGEVARGFVAEIVKPDTPDEKSLAILERARQLRSDAHTDAARKWLSGDDPLLVVGRERLGVTAETERPFEVIAVKGNGGTYESNSVAQAQWSKALTESDQVMPSVFVYKTTMDTPPIMVLDETTISLLQDPLHRQYYGLVPAFIAFIKGLPWSHPGCSTSKLSLESIAE